MPKTIRDTDIEAGARIKEMRKASGLSQGDLAEGLGITFQQIQKYENGSNRMSVGVFVAICQTLGASPMDILSTFFVEEELSSYPRLSTTVISLKEKLTQIRNLASA
jgi:transcriptional regulator with XRE-family HTH domain